MSLFDVFVRTNSRFADNADSRYTYLNRSAQLPACRMRAVIDEWFSRYPAQDQHDLKRRFQSKRPWEYEAAFFELALHAMLHRLGCELEVHPDIAGISTHPDFLVKAPEGCTFILEAVLAAGETEQETAAGKLFATICDDINHRVRSPGFFVNVHVCGLPKQLPSGKRIAEFVRSLLEPLDPDKIPADYSRVGPIINPRCIYRIDDGCWLEFEPIPRRAEVRGTPTDRVVGITSSDGRCVDDVAPIREAILRKAGHYGDVDEPFVVAVNLMSPSVDIDAIITALTGKDGLWQSRRAKQVSAILVSTWLMPQSLPRAEVQLFHNPYANRPYDSILTALPQAFTREAVIHHAEGRSLADIFGLPLDWPRNPTEPKTDERYLTLSPVGRDRPNV